MHQGMHASHASVPQVPGPSRVLLTATCNAADTRFVLMERDRATPSTAESSFPQLYDETSVLLSRIRDLGVNLTSHSDGLESLQHVTAFWKTQADLQERHKASSCNVAVLGLAKSGTPHAPRPSVTCHCPASRGLLQGWLTGHQYLAGKSTVLNALIGSRVLPTSNVPETARITRVRHRKQCEEPVLAGSGSRQPIVGADAVHAHLEMLNRQVPLLVQASCWVA